MLDFRDPDFQWQPINNTFAPELKVPPFATAFLFGKSEASWEQAIVVYIDEQRQAAQFGTFGRTNVMGLPMRDRTQRLSLAGWHKRSGPDSEQPWVVSNGDLSGNLASWEDTLNENADFNDYQIELVVAPGPHPLTPLVVAEPATSVEFEAKHIASSLFSFSVVRDVAVHTLQGDRQKAVIDYADSAHSRILDAYRAANRETESWLSPLSADIALAAHLHAIAQTVSVSPLRKHLEELTERVAAASTAPPSRPATTCRKG